MSNTFRLVNNFHWIIVEDSETKTSLVANLLSKSNLNYTHLSIATPNEWKRKLKVYKLNLLVIYIYINFFLIKILLILGT